MDTDNNVLKVGVGELGGRERKWGTSVTVSKIFLKMVRDAVW